MEKQRDKASQQRQTKDLAPEREQRGDASTPAGSQQFGATEQEVIPLTPPTRDEQSLKDGKPADTTKAAATNDRQKAADEIDPADEITPG